MNWSRITALVLSIISLIIGITVIAYYLVWYIAPLAIIFAIVSIVLTNNYNLENPMVKESYMMPILSIVFSIIALIATIVDILIYMAFII